MEHLVQICRGFSVKQWKELRTRLANGDEKAWHIAVEVFERRVRERFLSSIETLLRADSGPSADVEGLSGAPADGSTLPEDSAHVLVPGFAIVALCCLLIETLQSFIEEAPVRPSAVTGPCLFPDGPCIRPPPSSTTDLFKSFLRRPSFAGAFDNEVVATSFVRGVRNGILHEAETRGWVIWRSEPVQGIVEPLEDGLALNRTAFCEAVRKEFDGYLAELRDLKSQRLRDRFLKKMDDIAKRS